MNRCFMIRTSFLFTNYKSFVVETFESEFFNLVIIDKVADPLKHSDSTGLDDFHSESILI
jgi:hypothetical protein